MKSDFLYEDSIVLLGYNDLKDAYVRKKHIKEILNYAQNNIYCDKQDLINDINDFLNNKTL